MKNYQRELEQVLDKIGREGPKPSLLLHSCCAPCSSYVLEYLKPYFHITVYYYNPNITDRAEYDKRVAEQKRLIGIYNGERRRPVGEESKFWPEEEIKFQAGEYEPGRFFETVKGMEKLPEGGERCFVCYRLRMSEAAKRAAAGGFDYFTTTLSISPHKNAQKLNEIGEELEREFPVRYLPADFKKRDGYKRSIELSARYGLYRQDYCGCVYSRKGRED